MVECHVRAQALKDKPLRLKGDHQAVVPHLPGKEQRVRPDVGADFEHDRAGLDDLPKQVDLPLGILAVQFE